MRIGFEIPLLVLMVLIVAAGWYINTHREEDRKPLYKRRHRPR